MYKKVKVFLLSKSWVMGKIISKKRYLAKTFKVYDRGGQQQFLMSNIVCIKADKATCTIHLLDGSAHESSHNIGSINKLLPMNFFGRHGKHSIVNYTHILSISKGHKCMATLKNNHICAISILDVARFRLIIKPFLALIKRKRT